jgi:hypothetical protein
MSKLAWGDIGERIFEIGLDRGVLYVPGEIGVAWMGLIAVTEEITGGEPRPYYIDGEKYLNLLTAEEFEATIESFGCPDGFGVCDGNVRIHTGLIATQQARQTFGLSYRTLIGNDVQGSNFAYKIHLVYNALAAPTERENTTLGDSADPTTYSWSITTKAPAITGYRRTAHLVVDTRLYGASVISDVEDLLYGTHSTDPILPDPDDLVAVLFP